MSAPAKSRRKGPRPKHQPQRTCIACRDKTAKRTLIRIVRTPAGNVEIDPTGRANGRGAYLCDDPLCWNRALRSNMLAAALRADLDDATLTRLKEFAATLDAERSNEEVQPEGVM
jgi:predicted RNA-binding protein YlxR (DUF448 family)